MRKYITGFYFSLPIQLFLLHFRRYQLLLILWLVLFATITGHFLHTYGADTLFLAPEYWGHVSHISMGITGFSLGVFIMSWNIATFILHTRYVTFLATTSQPFLKYCINNAVLPLLFLIVYNIRIIDFELHEELLSVSNVIFLLLSFLIGLTLSILLGFVYFFGADKTIYRRMEPLFLAENARYDKVLQNGENNKKLHSEMRVDWFLNTRFHLKKPRDVRHYSQEFLNIVFKRHHLAAVIAVVAAFVFLVLIGLLSDSSVFQIPAAASITLLFAILMGATGALSLFLKSWTLLVLLFLYFILNWLYQNNFIDLRNKAYGLSYSTTKFPSYNRTAVNALATEQLAQADKAAFLQTLEKWKARQKEEKPVMFIINVSGGGLRSASFTMHTLQRLDSLMQGQLIPHTVLITGASGGMLGAAYFRALYWEKIKGSNINLQNKKYVQDISRDLLNPLFSSFITRDILGPASRFEVNGYTYVKDRAYAFEQKLNANTHGLLNKKLGAYKIAEEEAILPTMFFYATITQDGRELIVGTRPNRYLMKPFVDTNFITPYEPDAVDYSSLLASQNPYNLNVLSALRMNATFPFVLPNVWLPTYPVIDVMDAGLRDNFGQETALRFISTFQNWIKENTSKVVLIQIRDRPLGDWDRPFESNHLVQFFTKPILVLQNNWFKTQDYYQSQSLDFLSQSFPQQFYRINFQYLPRDSNAVASLSFHLTASEKKDIAASLNNAFNQKSLKKTEQLFFSQP